MNKIQKYEKFLLEKDIEYLLEANIVFDDKFETLLSKIKGSEIRNKLLGLYGKEVDTNYNYITYSTHKEDKVLFIPDDKAKKVENPLTIKKSDMNVGRFVRAILTKAKIEFNSKDLEDFVSKYKATILIEKEAFTRFEIVKGDDIKKWYHVENYYKEMGTLGSSCMRYPKCQNFLSIYSENIDRVSLIILKSSEDTDKIVGRALLWLDDIGRKFMDRVYIVNSADTELFINFAKENEFYYKKNQSYYTGDPIMFNGEEINIEDSWVNVTLKKSQFRDYPYMDSLKYFIKGEDILTSNHTLDYDVELTFTEGGDGSCGNCGGRGSFECEECDGRGETRCYRCDGEGEVDCENCHGNTTEECGECDGEGEVDCENCHGEGCGECNSGKIECTKCEGEGNLECESCSGKGVEECSRCDGDGTNECGECYGSGRGECYECN